MEQSIEIGRVVEQSFYERSDVEQIAQDLLGKVLMSRIDGIVTAGIIVETEAYSGSNDKACHANNGKRTPRTEVMFVPAGKAYVYLCYGVHYLLNVVTNEVNVADAVLIRALQPLLGIEQMQMRRGVTTKFTKLCAGPGALTKALAIDKSLNAESLMNENGACSIHDYRQFPVEQIIKTTRIGVDYAGEDALLKRRFYWKGNPHISKS